MNTVAVIIGQNNISYEGADRPDFVAVLQVSDPDLILREIRRHVEVELGLHPDDLEDEGPNFWTINTRWNDFYSYQVEHIPILTDEYFHP